MAAGSSRLSMTNFLEYARVGLLFGGIVLVMVTVFEVGMMAMRAATGESESVEYPQPDYAFGQLPGIRFPYQSNVVRPQNYQANFGAWPYYGEYMGGGYYMVPIYKLPKVGYDLTSDQKARQIAMNLGFADEPQIIDQRTYLYNYPGPPLRETLQIDLKTMFFEFDTNYLSSSNIFGTIDRRGDRQIPLRTDAIKATRDFLSAAGIAPRDLSDQASSVQYMTSIGDSLQLVNTALEADYAVVNLAREPVEGKIGEETAYFNFYGPDGYGSIRAVVGRDSSGQDAVVELTDNYHELDLSTFGTYPLTSASAAWETLTAGGGYIINPRGVRTAVIDSIEFGYYESHDEQEFLLPIYVFRGQNDFMAYVPALLPGMYY